MYFDTQIEQEYEVMNEFIESEMHKVKDQVVGNLNKYFVHNSVSIRSLILTIAYAYSESYKPAEILAQELNLGKLEFLAVMEDLEAFKEEYLKDLELAQNF